MSEQKKFMELSKFTAFTANYQRLLEDLALDDSEVPAQLIAEMNRMYDLPINVDPSITNLGKDTPLTRLGGFMNTLQDEINEGWSIKMAMEARARLLVDPSFVPSKTYFDEQFVEVFPNASGKEWIAHDKWVAQFFEFFDRESPKVENIEKFILVSLADWFADLTVYLWSEATKFGIPLMGVFKLVMASNFSKLGADGQPIKDPNGKFLKGPNYAPPERYIEALLFHREQLGSDYSDLQQAAEEARLAAAPVLNDLVDPVMPEPQNFLKISATNQMGALGPPFVF